MPKCLYCAWGRTGCDYNDTVDYKDEQDWLDLSKRGFLHP